VCDELLDRFDAADREVWRNLMTWLHSENAEGASDLVISTLDSAMAAIGRQNA
jgi:hypothetical protein